MYKTVKRDHERQKSVVIINKIDVLKKTNEKSSQKCGTYKPVIAPLNKHQNSYTDLLEKVEKLETETVNSQTFIDQTLNQKEDIDIYASLSQYHQNKIYKFPNDNKPKEKKKEDDYFDYLRK